MRKKERRKQFAGIVNAWFVHPVESSNASNWSGLVRELRGFTKLVAENNRDIFGAHNMDRFFNMTWCQIVVIFKHERILTTQHRPSLKSFINIAERSQLLRIPRILYSCVPYFIDNQATSAFTTIIQDNATPVSISLLQDRCKRSSEKIWAPKSRDADFTSTDAKPAHRDNITHLRGADKWICATNLIISISDD
jgi:hypothetical protein